MCQNVLHVKCQCLKDSLSDSGDQCQSDLDTVLELLIGTVSECLKGVVSKCLRSVALECLRGTVLEV